MIRLITLNPGHFHAALIQKEMPAGIDPRVTIYAPPGPDLDAHLARIQSFNQRAHAPTNWELDVRASEDWRERFRADPAGDVAVIAGRNRGKIDLMRLAVDAGLHVLADKPWIIEAEDFPKLRELVDVAQQRGLIIFDVMTERHEITSILQRMLIHDPIVFGELPKGSEVEPTIVMESVHYLRKLVAGQPLRRPPWFFDITEQGEALADVGTHLVDLAMWQLFPNAIIEAPRDVQVLRARRWPVQLSAESFTSITGTAPAHEPFDYWCNNSITFTIRGVHVHLNVLWDVDSPGSDLHEAIIIGTRSKLVIHQEARAGSQPELSIVPLPGVDGAELLAELPRCFAPWPGVVAQPQGDGRIPIHIPAEYRVGHEAHFAAVVRHLLGHLHGTIPLASWEMPNLLSKYYLTTSGVAAARSRGDSL